MLSYYLHKLSCYKRTGDSMSGYKMTTLSSSITIEHLVTVHYFEYMSDFYFKGECHDFWEFLCVDKGEIEVLAGNSLYTLKKGEIIFHKPNEFHNLKANGITAPNLVVIAFSSSSPAISFFKNKILTINDFERSLLSEIIVEYKQAFDSPLDDPSLKVLEKLPTPAFGSEQLMKQYLEHFLIHLYRRYNKIHTRKKQNTQVIPLPTLDADSELILRVITYMENNLHRHLTIEELCKKNLVGRSHLQKLFRDKKGCGVIEYFSNLKIEAAKQLIRNSRMNFTEIADSLGYTSIHYFSRQFKKLTDMSPREYASSIKKLTDISNSME